MEFEETQKEFDKIEWSETQKKIIELVRQGFNFYEIAEKLDANTRTLGIHLNRIYNKTASVIKYTTFRKFATLQFFLTELKTYNGSKEQQRTTAQSQSKNPQSNTISLELHRLRQENIKLKERIKTIESSSLPILATMKENLRNEIEKLNHKLELVEDLIVELGK